MSVCRNALFILAASAACAVLAGCASGGRPHQSGPDITAWPKDDALETAINVASAVGCDVELPPLAARADSRGWRFEFRRVGDPDGLTEPVQVYVDECGPVECAAGIAPQSLETTIELAQSLLLAAGFDLQDYRMVLAKEETDRDGKREHRILYAAIDPDGMLGCDVSVWHAANGRILVHGVDCARVR